MECPKCKNPLSDNNASVCDWCGYQLPIPKEPLVKRIKRLVVIYAEKIRANKKKYYRMALIFCGFTAVVIALIYFINNTSASSSSQITNAPKVKIIIPHTWQQKSAFDYLTNVRNQILNNKDSFEQLAIKYSQDTLSAGYRGQRINEGQFGDEFDEMVKLIEVNQVSEIFKIYDEFNSLYRYGFIKLLEKGNGFYKIQYIVRNINLEIGQYYRGGIIFKLDENQEHGLVITKGDFDSAPFSEAKRTCEELDLNGFTDWRLPSKDELELIFQLRYDIGRFNTTDWNSKYWSSSEIEDYSYQQAWVKGFYYDDGRFESTGQYLRFRAVRTF